MLDSALDLDSKSQEFCAVQSLHNAMMTDQLNEFLIRIKGDSRLTLYDEAATKQALILPVLSILGWNVWDVDEVRPEYGVAGNRVDYALRISGNNRVFIEAKKVGERLDGHDIQLLGYSFREGVRLAVLTNGITWWFFLPLKEGGWDQRKFYTVDIEEQETEDISDKFRLLLAREPIESGAAIAYAEQLFEGRQRLAALAENLPKAWNQIVSEPDPILVELINETVERISGFKAENEQISTFLADNRMTLLISTPAIQPIQKLTSSKPNTYGNPPRLHRETRTRHTSLIRESAASEPQRPRRDALSYSGKKPSKLTFLETDYPVASWQDLWATLVHVLSSKHSPDFERCLEIRGKKRPYFTRLCGELRQARQITGTTIYMETNLSADEIVRLSQRLIHLFGYEQHDMQISLR